MPYHGAHRLSNPDAISATDLTWQLREEYLGANAGFLRFVFMPTLDIHSAESWTPDEREFVFGAGPDGAQTMDELARRAAMTILRVSEEPARP